MSADTRGSRARVLRFTVAGAFVGILATLAFVYVPSLLSGDGYYEHTDALLWVGILFVPFGAALGTIIGLATGPRLTRGRRVGLAIGLGLGLWAVWEVWSFGTGAPGLL